MSLNLLLEAEIERLEREHRTATTVADARIKELCAEVERLRGLLVEERRYLLADEERRKLTGDALHAEAELAAVTAERDEARRIARHLLSDVVGSYGPYRDSVRPTRLAGEAVTLPRLIIVAGPAGSGKTTWAYGTEALVPIVHTDDFIAYPREVRPRRIHFHIQKEWGSVPLVIVEGCESLRFVAKMNEVAKRVDRVIWIDGYEKPGTTGLTTQQRKYLEQLKDVLPPVEVVPGKPKTEE